MSNSERISFFVSIVAVGFKTSNYDFAQYISRKGLKDQFELEIQKQNIQFSNGIVAKDINVIEENFPIVTYTSKKQDYSIILFSPENKITITNNKFNENNNSNFENFVKDILDSNLSQIEAIGINYNASYKRESKLKLFNPQIVEKEFFKNNSTFSVTIPSEPDNGVVATYVIQKVPQDNEKDTQERVYGILANYNLNLVDSSSKDKFEKITRFIDDCSQDLYNKYNDACDEILNMEL